MPKEIFFNDFIFLLRLHGFLFSAIFYGVEFPIKKGIFYQNPVNTPYKIGEPIIISKNKFLNRENS